MYGFQIMIEGEYACFTRPEMKVERVSYDVPTPGALEGLLKSVYWKPAIRYVIDQIIVFHPIQFLNVRRNEVKEKVLLSAMKSQMNGKGGDLGFMSYKVVFRDGGIPVNGNWEEPIFSDRADTVYYRPHMIGGVIDVARYKEGWKC